MAKTSNASQGSRAGRYESVGRTSDGVTILKPAIPPKHFTYREIRRTIEAVKKARAMEAKRDTAPGQFADSPQAPFKRK